MAKRPAGIRAILDAFDQGDLDVGALRAFDRPAYFALGGRSNPDYFASMAKRLAAMLPDLTIETFGTTPLRPSAPRRARELGQLAAHALAARRQ